MPGYQFSPMAVPATLTAAVVLSLAIGLLATRFSRTTISLFAVALSAAAWQIAWVFMSLAVDARTSVIWARIGFACALFIAPALYQFVGTILESRRHRRVVAVVGWLAVAHVAVVTLVTDHVINGVRRIRWGFHPTYTTESRVLVPLVVGSLFVATVVEIVRAYRQTNGTYRDRLRLFSIATAIGSLAGADFLPSYGIPVATLGWAPLLGSFAVAVYAIRKHGLGAARPPLPAAEIIGMMRDLLLVSDGEGRIQFANNAACAFLGFARKDIIGRPLEDLLVPTDANAAAPLQGWVRDREYVFRTNVGQPIELTLSHSPLTRRGKFIGAVFIGRDLRERKRYEWEARRAVTLLQSTLDSTADGILVIGQDGRVLTWNQRFADMWGIPAAFIEEHEDDEGVIGKLVEKLVDPAEFLDTLASLHERPEDESDSILQLRDGRRLEEYSIGRYLGDELVRVWSFRDVTARLTAEEALRDSEARYRLLFEQNAAGVCVATVSGRILNCNATFAEMVGRTADELKNCMVQDIFGPDDAAEAIQRQLATTPAVRGLEIELRRPDGERISVLANVSLLGEGERALVHMTAVDISDRKRAQEQIEFHAYHDALTQLPNRRLFLERLEMSLLSGKRTGISIAVLFIDLDRFKMINDTLGHDVADGLLIEIAQRLQSCVRPIDTVARYGGDEFTILLPDLQQPEDSAKVAEKILERVNEPIVVGANSIDMSVSIGIAVHPFDGTDVDTLLRNADDAMYRAKQGGRNAYQLSTEQIKTRAMERLSMQSRLRKAMDNGELTLAYEPQFSLITGSIVGVEAMIRWHDPERGNIEARDFIAAAEETRLIVPLGEWTLFTACRQIRQWSDAGKPPLRMAVNLSGRQFQQRDLPSVLGRVITDAGINPALLELEIHEAIAMRDLDLTVEL
ncbi:MAG TPA: diguanylate cyclase, partial [Gemmatimonadaceae bacterium]|nr:diguanylate cyclase [Gemmatimonadaceae bacterium]